MGRRLGEVVRQSLHTSISSQTPLTCISKAQDPEIRRIAEEAETRLVRDPNSGYQPWPSQPPPGPPPALTNGYAPPQPAANSPHDLVPLSPSPDYTPPAQHSVPVPPQIHSTVSSTAHAVPYSSPYGYQPPPNSSSTQAPAAASSPNNAPSQAPPTSEAGSSTDTWPAHHPQHAHHPPGPALQPAAPVGVVLSRRRETKILLSIDGDGIRGLSALLVIESLVNAICVQVGQRLDPHQIFDLTGGSSLGGVIAILLCRLRMQAHRAREAYKQIARQVYLNKRDFFVSLDPHSHLSSVDGTALEAEIKAVLQQELGNENELLLDGREDSGDV